MKRILWILLAGLVAQPALAATGTMIKDDILRSAPSSGGSKVASVSKGSTVEVLARQGGWTQIRSGSRSGWVRILSVRSTVSTGSAEDLAALASKREGSQVVAVAGLRGLSEEELKSAKFDAKQLALLDKYKVDANEAKSFAQAANLIPRKVKYLPEPKQESSTTTNTGQGWGF